MIGGYKAIELINYLRQVPVGIWLANVFGVEVLRGTS